jgi:integrase/recombinase XerC
MPKHMSYDDFLKLEKYYKALDTGRLKNHLQYFLFSCTTGLRYGDMKQLTWQHIQDERIYIRMQKTGEAISVPISVRAMKYLPEKKDLGQVFVVPTNQVANRYLKEIGTAAGVQQQLSTHVARHTFASLSLNIGIPLHVVQKLLGHASLKTTEIYARVIDKTVSDEIKKWENI